jgi:hypothetical protein
VPQKTKGEYAVAIHKAVADLNCLMANAGTDGIRVDMDMRQMQTVRGSFPALAVTLYEKITP